MKKTYEPSSSDIEYLNYIQSIENEIQRIRKQGTQVRIGFLISGVIATIMTLFYQKNENNFSDISKSYVCLLNYKKDILLSCVIINSLTPFLIIFKNTDYT